MKCCTRIYIKEVFRFGVYIYQGVLLISVMKDFYFMRICLWGSTHYFVHNTVLYGLFGTHPVIPVEILHDLFNGLTTIIG